LTVGILAGRNWRSRLGYAAVAFGVWDIFYYLFLKVICGWPNSVLDWDILFLIPLPWWGPVLAPVLIALLLIAWGTLASQVEHTPTRLFPGIMVLTASAAGIALALYIFMADAIAAAHQSALAVRNVLPTTFHWPQFCAALLLLAAPVFQRLWLIFSPSRNPYPETLDEPVSSLNKTRQE
jgi:hypothetical protein